MFRKLCMLIAMALTMCGAFFVADADAQAGPTCDLSFLRGPVIVPTPTAVEVVETPVPATPTVAPTVEPTVTTDTDLLTATASAQAAESIEDCADAVAYPGPFTNMPATPTSPYAVPRSIKAPEASATAPAVTAPASGPDLAHSGSEVVVLGYLGTGLLAFGAVLLGVRRGGFVE